MTRLFEAYVQTQSGLWECNSTGYLGTPVSRQPIPVGSFACRVGFCWKKVWVFSKLNDFGTEVAVSLWTGHKDNNIPTTFS